MKSIRLENVTKIKDGVPILDNVSLTIPAGQFFALLGPSGCGKTTILRLISGFEKPDRGRIYLGEEEITNHPIHERRINIVFQNYALFPHLSVFENIAYSLHLQNRSKTEIRDRVYKLLTAFHLEKQAYRYPTELSGGQQQRVAIARAIINEPEVLLLDEPLAALDFKLRERMLIELIELQDKLSTTFVYVTHDQFEALTVADHMAIMHTDGIIEQIGTPKDIYEFPNSSFVARFVGSTNLFEGSLSSKGPSTITIPELGDFNVFIPESKAWLRNHETAMMSLRPEKVYITKNPTESNFSNCLKGIVQSMVYHGRSTQYNVRLNNGMIVQAFEQNEEHFPQEHIDYDDEVFLYWQKENVVLLEN